MRHFQSSPFESVHINDRIKCLFVAGLPVLILALLLMTPSLSFAQAKMGVFEGMLDGLKNAFAGLINSTFGQGFSDNVKNAAISMAAALVGPAKYLAGAIGLITLIWRVMLAMASKESVLNATLEVLIFGLIAALLIDNYEKVVNQVWDIANQAMEAVGLGIGQTFAEFVTSFLAPIGDTFKNWQKLNEAKGIWSSLFSESTLDLLGSIIMTIAIIILLALAVIEIVGVFVMGPVFFAVGVVFAPLMIATIISGMTRKWFEQWFNYMVGSAFLTAVAVAVMKLLTLSIGGAVKNLGQGGSTTLALLGIVLLMGSAAKLFSAVPSITDAIFPGRTGAGAAIAGGGGGVVKNMVAGAAGAAVGAAAAAAGKGSVSGTVGRAVSGMSTALKNAAGVARNSSKQNPVATAAGMLWQAGGKQAASALGSVGRTAVDNARKSVGGMRGNGASSTNT